MGGFQSSHSVLLELSGIPGLLFRVLQLGHDRQVIVIDSDPMWPMWCLAACLPKYHSVSFYEHLTSCHVAIAAFSMIPFFTTQAIETGLPDFNSTQCIATGL